MHDMFVSELILFLEDVMQLDSKDCDKKHFSVIKTSVKLPHSTRFSFRSRQDTWDYEKFQTILVEAYLHTIYAHGR